MFWVILVQFDLRNTLLKLGPFLLGHPVYLTAAVFVFLFQRLLSFDVYIFWHQLTVSAYFIVPVLSSLYLVFLQLLINFACWASIILKFSTPCILAVHFFFLFQLNSHNMLNTYIYHLFPPTCFSVFTPSSGRALCYLFKNYMLFAMLLHKKKESAPLYRHWSSVQAVWPIRGVEVSFYLFLTTALEGGEESVSRPGRSLPRERPGTHCTGGWVGPRAGLDRCEKSHPHRDLIPRQSSPTWPTMLLHRVCYKI